MNQGSKRGWKSSWIYKGWKTCTGVSHHRRQTNFFWWNRLPLVNIFRPFGGCHHMLNVFIVHRKLWLGFEKELILVFKQSLQSLLPFFTTLSYISRSRSDWSYYFALVFYLLQCESLATISFTLFESIAFWKNCWISQITLEKSIDRHATISGGSWLFLSNRHKVFTLVQQLNRTNISSADIASRIETPQQCKALLKLCIGLIENALFLENFGSWNCPNGAHKVSSNVKKTSTTKIAKFFHNLTQRTKPTLFLTGYHTHGLLKCSAYSFLFSSSVCKQMRVSVFASISTCLFLYDSIKHFRWQLDQMPVI